jgi:hypothetical protein
LAGNPEKDIAYPKIEDLVYGYDAFGAGDAVQQEPIEEPIYAYDASGARDDVREPIEVPAYAYDASGASDYVQESIEEPAYAYDASGAGDNGHEPTEKPFNAYDASGASNNVQEPIEEPAYVYDASGAGDYVQKPINETIIIDARKVLTRALRERKLQSTSITVQAESYQAMFGVGIENTNDVNGGQHVGFIDTNDWMAYPAVTLPSAGFYRVEYRVASQSGRGSLRLENSGGSPVYGSLSISTPGGWQNWVKVSHTVNLNAGSNWFAIYATQGGWRLNWFRISLATTQIAVTPPPVSLNLNPFYTKYVSARGLPVVASVTSTTTPCLRQPI